MECKQRKGITQQDQSREMNLILSVMVVITYRDKGGKMETIKINDMQTKGVVFIVKYLMPNDAPGCATREATLNVNFNKQEIWYLENEVGIGGTVSVLITPSKCGRYINIKAVDMKSAVKGNQATPQVMASPEEGAVRYFEDKLIEKVCTKTDREKTIIAQCLTKVFCRNQQMDEPKYVFDTYNYFLGELE